MIEKIKGTKIFIAILLLFALMKMNANASENDSLTAESVAIFYGKIQKILCNQEIDSLRQMLYSDTIEYFVNACPDPDSVGKLSKFIWGTNDFKKYIIGSFEKSSLFYIVPKNDSLIRISIGLCNDRPANQNIKIKRNKKESKWFETIEMNCTYYVTDYAVQVYLKRLKQNKFKIIRIQINESC
jgi:hypothetical protein